MNRVTTNELPTAPRDLSRTRGGGAGGVIVAIALRAMRGGGGAFCQAEPTDKGLAMARRRGIDTMDPVSSL